MVETRFTTCPAPPALAGAVAELWTFEHDGRFGAGLPKPYVELVVSLAGTHWWRARPDGAEHRYADSWVTPIQDGPRYARSMGRAHLIGARLEPWAAVAMFGPLPRGNGTPPPRLASFLGEEAERLRASLIDAGDDEERFARFSAWLEAQPALHRASRIRSDRQATRGNATALAREVGLSPRSLRRRFATEAGLSPKQWLKLHRLDAVLRDPGLTDPEATLADLAYAHGYADQAHLAREMARLTGSTAGALRPTRAKSPPHFRPQD
ncbi:helix-turn-helix transcriptional regulator [Allosphingosinicella indica]|uniref:AraC-type DNA-binding protein n=1 Tax=Allosphingosinicella indica TaxID=941907 RepID=A0A1X7FZ55_9SPHN|nr:helix-turn-helix transcriptional regulator [Allosphingosinicella indica]SMF61414.1 AraC-type DNA-binding protein [Allosphingosinicella indica]